MWIVNAKSYKGKVEQREHRPFWRRESEVFVGRRNRTALNPVAAVKAALEPDPELKGTPVYGSLACLTLIGAACSTHPSPLAPCGSRTPAR